MADQVAADWHHAKRVYDTMIERSKLETLEDGEQAAVYEGFLTALITQDLNLSTPYYTKITTILKGMGCIKQLRRGGGSSPSQWLLCTAPTMELFDEWVLKAPVGPKKDLVNQRFNDLERRIVVLENALRGVIDGNR